MKKSLLALTIILCTSTYAQYTVVFGKIDNIKFVESEITEPETPVDPEVPEEPADPNKDNNSCKSLLNETPTLSNGVYQIKSGSSEIPMYCDMANGGWTLVAVGIRYNVAGWNTSGGLNMSSSPNPSIGFKIPDVNINNIPKNTFKVTTTGIYANSRYFSGNCHYTQTGSATGACVVSYANEGLNAGIKVGEAHYGIGGLSDFSLSTTLLYVVTSYIDYNTPHGWGMGNGVNAGYSGTAAAGDGGNIQIWVK